MFRVCDSDKYGVRVNGTRFVILLALLALLAAGWIILGIPNF